MMMILRKPVLMIKKPIFSRIIGLTLLYAVVFILIVMLHFTREGRVSRQTGPMTVTGYYREGNSSPDPVDGYAIEGTITISFGGMEFRLDRADRMIIGADGVSFRLPVGTLQFVVLSPASGPELRISADLTNARLELPYRPLESSQIRSEGNANITVTAEGVNYSFEWSSLDSGRGVLILDSGNPVAIYRALPEEETFNPASYALATAWDQGRYDDALNRWRNESWNRWSRMAGSSTDETLITAYAVESVLRGTYRAAVAGVSPSFLNGSGRTYLSSVFLGQTDQGRSSLLAAEQVAYDRISRLTEEKSPDLFRESHIIEYLGIRGYSSFLDNTALTAQSLEENPGMELVPGLLEAWAEWQNFRPSADNPFDGFIEGILLAVSESLYRDTERDAVLVLSGEESDTEFNIRLGLALNRYGSLSGRDDWAALGRSLVLSALAYADPDGMVPAQLSLTGAGILEEPVGGRRISAAGLYRYLVPGSWPRFTGIGEPGDGIWVWTAALGVETSLENNVLDIAVTFPAGETHYMIFRGVNAFSKIQLYNMDYRTDPQFERYDSSGWSYSSRDQVLLVKMRHRAEVEHISIFF
ncbi:MAG: hypothetical protein LBT11_07670 [Treponema sp.]|jgi:hypothetical protein|nr:hypothetical protein [Treponema sp.]